MQGNKLKGSKKLVPQIYPIKNKLNIITSRIEEANETSRTGVLPNSPVQNAWE